MAPRSQKVPASSSAPRRVRALGNVRQGAIAVVGWLVLVRAEAAHAANVGAAVELDEQRCVTLDAVRAAAALRGGRVDADSTVRLRVHVREAEPPSAVTLEISGEGAHGAIEARTIVADSCAEAASALGLVVTMAGEDEQAQVEPSRAEPPSLTPPERPSQGTTRELSPTPKAPPARPSKGTARELSPTPKAPPARPSKGTARKRSPTSAASPARPSRATARETTPATKLYTSLGLVATPLYEGPAGARLSGGFASGRLFFPWAELGMGATLPRTVFGGGAAVNLTWFTARASLAPLGASLGDHVFVSAYIMLDVGAVLASGEGAPKVDSRWRPWLEAGAGARMRALVGAWSFVEGQIAAALPLRRDEFYFVHGGTAYQAPAVRLDAALSVGIFFP
ncbi:hypothetical protein [Sorangium sp. So ce124]|uniref:hypothetical protein n=1 Tax=Sorangium sp. So ce124 TaxID=3133280 RepID=UPI003F6465A1